MSAPSYSVFGGATRTPYTVRGPKGGVSPDLPGRLRRSRRLVPCSALTGETCTDRCGRCEWLEGVRETRRCGWYGDPIELGRTVRPLKCEECRREGAPRKAEA